MMRGAVVGLFLLASSIASAQVTFDKWIDPGPERIMAIPSPNHDGRPPWMEVDTIVLHHTAAFDLVGTIRWFTNPESKVSAHFTIGRDGSIIQHVSTWQRAWHAGVSLDKHGRTRVNDFSIGIELVNIGDGTQDYTAPQLESLRRLIGVLVQWHPIAQITSHAYVAVPAGRKNDPINFPWQTLAEFHLPLVY